MKIGLQTWGTDGDIRPLIALAGGLSAAGHEVTVAVTSCDDKDYSNYARNLHFTIEHVVHMKHSEAFIDSFTENMRRTKVPLHQVAIILKDFFDPYISAMYAAAKRLCQDNDVVIGHFCMHPLQAAAEKNHTPYITVTLNHSAIESRFVTPFGAPNIGQWANPFLWSIGHHLVDMVLAKTINRLRRQEGLPRAAKIIKTIWTSEILNLIAVSPTLCKTQPDWGENQQVCGFFNVPEFSEDWLMPKDLQNFLDAGEPPVYLTLGSMTSLDADPASITTILVKGAQLAGCRAIIQSSWEEISDIPDDKNIYRIGKAPHRAIFPFCVAVVHHGGAGTTHSASRYGCPSIIVEHFADQSFWGMQLQKLGLSPLLLHRRTLSAEKLATALKILMENDTYRRNALKVCKQMQQEHGVEQAVKLIEKVTEIL